MTPKGYIIPETIDPKENVCIRVYVPNDPLYIGAFWNAYEFFTKWNAWERDEAKRGADAAAVWRSAFTLAREQWDCSEGNCGIMDVRQANTPCILEKQTDCDGTWETFANLVECIPRMRLVSTSTGLRIQQWNGTEWVDVAEDLPDFEDRFDGPYTPQWTNPPVGEAGDCLAAVNAAYTLNKYMTDVAQLHVNAAAFLTIFSSVVAAVALWVDFPLSSLATDLIAAFAEFAGDWQDVVDYDMTSALVPILLCRYQADGSMTKGDYVQVLADMGTYRSGLLDDYKLVKWALAILYVNVLGNVGMSRLAASAGIVTGECSGVDCGWYVDFDFTQDDFGWEPVFFEGYDAGHWTSGVGWQGVFQGTLGVDGGYRVWITSPVVSSATYYKGLVDVDYEEDQKYARWSALDIRLGGVPDGYFFNLSEVYDPPSIPDGIMQGEEDLEGTQAGGLWADVKYPGDQPEQGAIGGLIVKRIRLFGTGTNPWE